MLYDISTLGCIVIIMHYDVLHTEVHLLLISHILELECTFVYTALSQINSVIQQC